MKSKNYKLVWNIILCVVLASLLLLNDKSKGINCVVLLVILPLNIVYLYKICLISKEKVENKRYIKFLKFPIVIELLNIITVNILLFFNIKDNVSFFIFELLKTNVIYLVNFIMFLNIWISIWKDSFFGFLKKKNDQIKCDEDERKNLELSLEAVKKQLDYFFIWLVIVCICLIFIKNYIGKTFTTFDLAMSLLIVFPLVMIFTETVIYLKLETIQKDSFWSLNVWNYLIYQDEIKGRQKGREYLTNREIFLRNRGSITIEEISNVRKSLQELKKDQLINLIYFKDTPYYFDDFYFSGQRLLKIVKNIIISFSTIRIGGDVIAKFFQGESNLSELLNNITVNWYMALLIGVILIFMYIPILALYHLLNCTQKRKQVDYLLTELLAKECIERNLEDFNIKAFSEVPKKKYFRKYINLNNIKLFK